MTLRKSRDFPVRDFVKHKSKTNGDCCVYKFLQRRADGKHLMRSNGEAPVFKFPFRSVDEALTPLSPYLPSISIVNIRVAVPILLFASHLYTPESAGLAL